MPASPHSTEPDSEQLSSPALRWTVIAIVFPHVAVVGSRDHRDGGHTSLGIPAAQLLLEHFFRPARPSFFWILLCSPFPLGLPHQVRVLDDPPCLFFLHCAFHFAERALDSGPSCSISCLLLSRRACHRSLAEPHATAHAAGEARESHDNRPKAEQPAAEVWRAPSGTTAA